MVRFFPRELTFNKQYAKIFISIDLRTLIAVAFQWDAEEGGNAK